MTDLEILEKTDHTLLKQDSTLPQILELCREGLCYHTASVCLPPRFVRDAAAFLQGRLPVCTVIGFPLGYQSTAAKCTEAENALINGAAQLDVVIPLGEVKTQNFAAVEAELAALRELCGKNILKVIVETCLLTQAEKITLCGLAADVGADFIKTSTGFSAGGATVEDVRLFCQTRPNLKVKASGGIRTFDFARTLLSAGASRIGASALVGLVK